MFSAELLERFYHPRWVGTGAAAGDGGVADHADGGRVWASATAGQPTCGDVVQIDVELVGGRIRSARFRTLGCAVAIAASDAVCELAGGQTPTAARYLHLDEVTAALGGIPPNRESCASAPLAALRAALRTLEAETPA